MRSTIDGIKSDRRVRLAYFVAFLILIISFAASILINKRLREQADYVNHTNTVILRYEALESSVKDAEAASRGYFLRRDRRYLKDYLGSHAITDSIYTDVMRMSGDNLQQQVLLRQLYKSISAKYEGLFQNVAEFESNGKIFTLSMSIRLDSGAVYMNRIRSEVRTLQQNESALLGQRLDRVAKNFKTLNTITYVSIVLAFIIIGFAFIIYRKENRGRRLALDSVLTYQEQLKNRISELDAANTELIRMRALEKFAATGRIARIIAHEVRNPLTNIDLAANQLRTEFEQPDEMAIELFEMINRNSNRINGLISDLLRSTKFSELKREAIYLTTLLDETLQLAHDRISLNKVEVVKNYEIMGCTLYADVDQLRLALLNIVTNAVESMDDLGRPAILTVSARGVGTFCEIVITDTGSGMDADTQLRLFEPYFSTKQKGNGLGMTNTQNIILNHKGELDVNSEVGVGTSFIIRLPLGE